MMPEEVKTATSDIQSSIAKLPMKTKIVEPENLHISLSFLGDVTDEDVPGISRDLDCVCRKHGKFTARVGGMRLIPNERNLRVIALEVKSSGDVLEELRKDVVGVVGGDSKPCHLTLARVREVWDRALVIRRVKELDLEKYFEVSSVCLVKSVGTRNGRIYQILHESRLG